MVAPVTLAHSHQPRSLQLIGLVWVLIGVGTLLDPPSIPGDTVYLLEALPTGLRAGLWLASGALAVLLSMCPPGAARWGFVALVVPAALRGFSYLWGAVILTVQGDSSARAWAEVIQWLVVVMFVIHEAATPEPARVEVPE